MKGQGVCITERRQNTFVMSISEHISEVGSMEESLLERTVLSGPS